jgi:hypothetical protein
MPDTRGALIAPIPLINRQPSRALFFGTATDLIADVSNSTWFTPGIPITPQAPVEERPRRFDYPSGINISFVPRAEEQITMDQLRNLAELWDLLRLVLETRKDQIAGIPWVVRPRKEPNEKNSEYKLRAKDDARIPKAMALWKRPDGERLWQSWIRILLEEMFVLDALTLYPYKPGGGTELKLDILDGGTIKRLLDSQGRTPQPPSMAYEQIIKGVPAFGFRSDQLLYRPRNARAWKLYGYSPVEQVVITINLAVRRQLYKLNYYTAGNMPEAIVQMPDTWPPDRIKQFQEWWNSMLTGQLDTRRQFFFVPGFGGKDAISYPKQDVIKDEMDEWLARVVCYAFSVSPQPFIKEGMSRFGVQQQQQTAKAEGLIPTLSWISEVLTDVMENYMGWAGLEFVFQEDLEPDLLKRAQVQEIRARNGLSQIDEIREENGDEEIGVGAGIITGTGFVPFEGQEGAPLPTPPPGYPGGPGRVVKRHAGGGANAYATRSQQVRQARLQQTLATFLRVQRETAARQLLPDYARHAPVVKSFREFPLVAPTDRPIQVFIHGHDGVEYHNGHGNGGPLGKVVTTGVKQALNVAADGLEAEMSQVAPVITPLGVGVAGTPAAAPSAFHAMAALLADALAVLKQQAQGATAAAAHHDLAGLEERFHHLEAVLASPPPAPDITVNVAPPPAPPAPEVTVQLPERTVVVEPGAVQVHVPPAPAPPAIKVEVAAAKAPDVTVQAPPAPPPAQITIINKQKRTRVKLKTVVDAKLLPGKRVTKVKRHPVTGDVEGTESETVDPDA